MIFHNKSNVLIRLFQCTCSKYRYLCHSSKSLSNFNEWYDKLRIPRGSDQETVRSAFLRLAKEFHPDSGHANADESKFQEIDEAYRNLLEKFANERWNVNECEGEYGLYYKEKEVEDFDIKHTAPQHRQFLSHDGQGEAGTTHFQREKRYFAARAAKAYSKANEYKISKLTAPNKSEHALTAKEKKKSKDVKTGLGIERLVEDLIQESMAKGEFDNLGGYGKPLPYNPLKESPYIDFVTHKMNQVLIDNGFVPAWITMHKEIRFLIDSLRHKLNNEISRTNITSISNPNDEIKHNLASLQDEVNIINEKIDDFNLIVPILQKQMFHINLNREIEKLKKGSTDDKILKEN